MFLILKPYWDEFPRRCQFVDMFWQLYRRYTETDRESFIQSTISEMCGVCKVVTVTAQSRSAERPANRTSNGSVDRGINGHHPESRQPSVFIQIELELNLDVALFHRLSAQSWHILHAALPSTTSDTSPRWVHNLLSIEAQVNEPNTGEDIIEYYRVS